MTKKWIPALYFVIGQVGWFACVLGAAKGVPWVGVIVVGVLLALHAWRAARPLDEVKFVGSVAVIGAVWESVLVQAGLIVYPSGMLVRGLAPYWIVAVWALFAAQFNTTYQWLKPRVPLAALFGAVAGPLSFRAGAALGALRFAKPWPAAAVLAIGWAALLPALVLLSSRWDGVRDESAVPA